LVFQSFQHDRSRVLVLLISSHHLSTFMTTTAAAAAAAEKPITAGDVLIYIPNLIGYGRVVAALGSFVVMVVWPDQYLLAVLLYLTNFIGDLVDGWAARRWQQTSSFGGVLDMITDRCGTAGFLFVLAGEYQQYYHHDQNNRHLASLFRLLFLSLMLLDISSHWVQVGLWKVLLLAAAVRVILSLSLC
jgi:CDP-diacylglycerol--inositol 3-phosphatidyltransferase